MAKSIPYTEPTPLIVMSPANPKFLYVDNKKTDTRKVDEQGRPLSGFQAFGFVLGDPSVVSVLLPDTTAAEFPTAVGDVVVPSGKAISLQLRGGDFGSLNATFVNIDQLDSLCDGEAHMTALVKGGK